MPDYGLDPAVLKGVIEDSGLTHTETVKSFVFDCPRCHGKKKLWLSKYSGRFVCFKCKETDNYQGRPEFALADLLNQDLKQVKFLLYGTGGGVVDVHLDIQLEDFFGDEEDLPIDVVEHQLLDFPHDYYEIDDPQYGPRGAAYLESRGIPLDIAKLYGLRFCPARRRVIFPIEDQGRVYGWQERTVVENVYVEDGELKEFPKIVSTKDIDRENLLMFVGRLRGSKHAVLGEGPIDAIKAHLCGGNVATMGKAVSIGQMNLIVNGGVTDVYMGLDPDAAEEVQRIVRDYSPWVRMWDMIPKGDGKVDLGARSFEENYELFRGASLIEAGRLFVFLRPF